MDKLAEIVKLPFAPDALRAQSKEEFVKYMEQLIFEQEKLLEDIHRRLNSVMGGVSGTFTSGAGKTITVTNGIVTAIAP